VGKVAVVCENEQARGRRVEAASGYQACHFGHQVGDGRAATIVVHGGQKTRRFVQSEVDVGFWQTDGTAVEFDLIFWRYYRAKGSYLAVHRHATG
jgi:hypothetical protein